MKTGGTNASLINGCFLSDAVPFALAIMTGISHVAISARNFFRIEMPSSFGSMISSRISSGFSLFRASQNSGHQENPLPQIRRFPAYTESDSGFRYHLQHSELQTTEVACFLLHRRILTIHTFRHERRGISLHRTLSSSFQRDFMIKKHRFQY